MNMYKFEDRKTFILENILKNNINYILKSHLKLKFFDWINYLTANNLLKKRQLLTLKQDRLGTNSKIIFLTS
jgi:hypothetical protein